jgi:hypothetical protein
MTLRSWVDAVVASETPSKPRVRVLRVVPDREENASDPTRLRSDFPISKEENSALRFPQNAGTVDIRLGKNVALSIDVGLLDLAMLRLLAEV